jgi:hypothetical protein
MSSLLESLVALALTLVLIGSAMSLVSTNSSLASAAPDMLDVQQRARLGADAIARHLLGAGAGLSVGTHAGPLVASFAPILPRRLGLSGDPYSVARPDAITIVSATTPAQSVLLLPMTSALDNLQVDASIGCPAGTQVCGLRQGSTALIFDGGGVFDLVGVLGLQGNVATIEHHQQGSPVFAYPAGAAVAEAEQHTFYFDAPNLQLRQSDGAHSDVPLVDNVVAVAFEYFGSAPGGGGALVDLPLSNFTDGPWRGVGSNRYDADLLRIRLVRVVIRVQASNPMLRGTSGSFAVPGQARGARTISDYTVRLDVSPRNLNPGK